MWTKKIEVFFFDLSMRCVLENKRILFDVWFWWNYRFPLFDDVLKAQIHQNKDQLKMKFIWSTNKSQLTLTSGRRGKNLCIPWDKWDLHRKCPPTKKIEFSLVSSFDYGENQSPFSVCFRIRNKGEFPFVFHWSQRRARRRLENLFDRWWQWIPQAKSAESTEKVHFSDEKQIFHSKSRGKTTSGKFSFSWTRLFNMKWNLFSLKEMDYLSTYNLEEHALVTQLFVWWRQTTMKY